MRRRCFLKRFTGSGAEVEFEAHFAGNDGAAFKASQQAALLAAAKIVAEHGAEIVAVPPPPPPS